MGHLGIVPIEAPEVFHKVSAQGWSKIVTARWNVQNVPFGQRFLRKRWFFHDISWCSQTAPVIRLESGEAPRPVPGPVPQTQTVTDG